MASITVEFFSKSLLRDVTFRVILPVDKIGFDGKFLRDEKPFKTLYLLHGLFGNETGWNTCSRICPWANARDLAVVMPAGENHYYTDCDKTGEKFGEFIGEELVEVTRRMFPLSRKREDTFIAGLSMGGYGAIHNGLKYHETFGHIAALSAAIPSSAGLKSADNSAPMYVYRRDYYEHVFGDLDKLDGSERDLFAQIEMLKKRNADIPKMYMCIGTEDPLYERNVAYRDFLREQNVDLTYVESPGNHDWDFWDTYIKKILDWLPLDDETQGVSDGHISE